MSRNLAIPKAEARIAVLQSCIDHIDSLTDDPIQARQGLMALDAAAKGDRARNEAAGMQEQIQELQQAIRKGAVALNAGWNIQPGSSLHEAFKFLMERSSHG